MASQFFLKTSQDIEVFQGYPEFKQCSVTTFDQDAANNSSVETLPADNSAGPMLASKQKTVIASTLSPCGRFLALSTKTAVKVFIGANFEELLITLDLPDVYDLHFSPSGNFLSTWERGGQDDKNAKIWYLNQEFDAGQDLEPCYSYKAVHQNSWTLQFSKLDNFALKQIGKEIRVVQLSKDNLKFDFENAYAWLPEEVENQNFATYLISTSEHPTICTFTPEKSGKPAHLTIWPITEGKITKKIATKTFFKADSCQLKWNPQGNAVLCLAITDFDSSNKSYYGENTLYLLSFQGVNGSLGGNSVRVPLGKEGPIHDFTWSPTSRQFGVIYGYMPATITFFDLKGNVVHSLPQQPKNTMLFSPTGRYILIAGFGNLQGLVEILDRHDKFKRVAKFDASNTSVCKWSPGGEFIMTATTSPRLRVDNGVKIWHVSGKLTFIKEFKELLKIDWRSNVYKSKSFKYNKDSKHVVREIDTSKDGDDKSMADPIVFGKDVIIHPSATEYLDERARKISASGISTGTKNSPSGAYRPPHARRAGTTPGVTRAVPGMAVNNKPKTIPGMAVRETKAQTKNRKKRANNQQNSVTSLSNEEDDSNNSTTTIRENLISPEEKKMRSLLKKLRAIENLKQRQAVGDKLEDTQVLKIQTEEKVLEELKNLGWTNEE